MSPPQQQNKPVVPKKEIVWMSCRMGTGCEGNQAYVSLIFRHKLLQGGGTTYRYRCMTCNGTWNVTR